MLRYRLVFGVLMTVALAALLLFDGWLDGSLTAEPADDKTVKATLLIILLGLVVCASAGEFASLARLRHIEIFLPLVSTASVLLAGSWYWWQFLEVDRAVWLLTVWSVILAGIFLQQAICCGTRDVLVNCGANCLAVIYLGIAGAFLPAIRIDFGPWALLMSIFTVKSADIGAYTAGKLFGRHRFSSGISPGKTWEGMAGAVVLAAAAAIGFCKACDIMQPFSAAMFGIVLAFVGQAGDLVESMLKRDVGIKDSSADVPGFGGVLDVVDSVLFAGPVSYLFFLAGGC